MLKQPIFVTGTDTNVGKTVVCAWLVHHLQADYWKPVQCGDLHHTDAMEVARLSKKLPHKLPHVITSKEETYQSGVIHPEAYQFTQSLSPHLAAEKNGITIDLTKIQIPATKNRLIIEGAGGVLVPVNRHQYMTDMIKYLNARVLVVSRGTLGTINHTCLTLEYMRAKGMAVMGVIINGVSEKSNRESIEYFGRVKVLAELPFMHHLDHADLSSHEMTQKTRDLLEQATNDRAFS